MGTPRRAGIKRFAGPADARLLHATQMMSMPTMDPPAPAELIEWATASGQVVKVLFGDPESGGMSLVWSWFAPHFPLPRHSHSADCLYYVSKGELHLGNQVVKEGEGFFVPSGAPYAYTAGPDGVEILEFRAVSQFDMQITESLPRWTKMVEAARGHREAWAEELPSHQ
jgi:quercetin dioxygenase-like cupin family protein